MKATEKLLVCLAGKEPELTRASRDVASETSDVNHGTSPILMRCRGGDRHRELPSRGNPRRVPPPSWEIATRLETNTPSPSSR